MSIQVKADWWKTMFDQVYLLTDQRTVCDPGLTRKEVDLVCRLLDVKPEENILDLCGGHGRHSLELCSRGYSDLTLLDYSQTLLSKAQAEAEDRDLELRIVMADARSIPLPGSSFDHILIMGNSLGYSPDPSSDQAILSECWRVLRPQGSLLVDVTDRETMLQSFCPSAWHEIDEDIVVCRKRELQGSNVAARELVLSKQNGLIRDETYAIRLYGRSELRQLLINAGFPEVRLHTNHTLEQEHGDCGFMNHRFMALGRKLQGE